MPDYINADRFPVRKNPRLRNFDYSSENYYFVTICTWNKECIFGSPTKLSSFGKVAQTCLEDIPNHFPGVMIDKCVVMPNHVHAIIVLQQSSVLLPTAIGAFKAAVSKRIHTTNPELSVWQSSFHDHVIRNQEDYQRIWTYIDANPIRWNEDCFYQDFGSNIQCK